MVPPFNKNVHNRNCSFKEKSNSTSKMAEKWIIVDIVKYKLSLAHSYSLYFY